MRKLCILIGIIIFLACDSDTQIEDFKSHAVLIEQNKVKSWFEPGVLPDSTLPAIVDTLNTGIALVNTIIGGPYNWQLVKDQAITYYFMPGHFVPHTTKSAEVILPIERYARTGSVPWLHETVHILLKNREGFWWPPTPRAALKMPQWFTEGMAEFLSWKIYREYHIPRRDYFNCGGYEGLDSTCYTSLKGRTGEKVLKHIGTAGQMLQLRGPNRSVYLPVFYNCSCSFTKYLAETYGMELVVTAISDYKEEIRTIEEMTGKSMEVHREEWLEYIRGK